MAISTAVLNRALVLAFADVLSYPYSPIDGDVQACEELARSESEEAAALLGRFRAFAEATPLGELQEAYTLAFDLDSLSESEPTCYPYVGHHLFEENHKRSASSSACSSATGRTASTAMRATCPTISSSCCGSSLCATTTSSWRRPWTRRSCRRSPGCWGRWGARSR